MLSSGSAKFCINMAINIQATSQIQGTYSKSASWLQNLEFLKNRSDSENFFESLGTREFAIHMAKT